MKATPIGYVAPPDRVEGEHVVKRQRDITEGDEGGRDEHVAPLECAERIHHVRDVDAAQHAIEHDAGDDDHREAQQKAEPVPADSAVEGLRGREQPLIHGRYRLSRRDVRAGE